MKNLIRNKELVQLLINTGHEVKIEDYLGALFDELNVNI